MPIAPKPVTAVQNGEQAQRLLAAQRRLYSDAKTIHAARLLIAALGAVGGVAAAISLPQWRTPIGVVTGVVLLIVGILGGTREKNKIKEASTVQEELDVMLFGLTWNDMCAEHPSPTIIANAATRHPNDPELRDWYPDTATVPYPMSVLICQNGNLGWGSSLHRAWAASVTGALLLLVFTSAGVAILLRMGFVEAVTAVLLPQLSLIKELYEMRRANLDSAQSKSGTEAKVLALWRRGLTDPASITVEDCRLVQDRILQLRQSNASIPDWFNNRMRRRQETSMRATADQLVTDAKSHGIA